MCECEEPTEFVKLRFIGGEHLKGRKRGPYASYDTGSVYVMPKRYADQEAYPYWKYVADACEDEIPPFWKKRIEEGMKKAEEFFSDPTESIKVQGEGVEESSTKSKGLTKAYGTATPTGIQPFAESRSMGMMTEQRLLSMEDEVLKAFITNNGGAVDGRWGRERLLEEARKHL